MSPFRKMTIRIVLFTGLMMIGTSLFATRSVTHNATNPLRHDDDDHAVSREHLAVASEIHFLNQAKTQQDMIGNPVIRQSLQLRKFPYPYDAMLSITSDADGLTLSKFELIHRFLNTHENTPLGTGLGLDISDSFFFFIGNDRSGYLDHPEQTSWQDQMSYFYRLSTSDLHDAKAIIYYSRVGWIDSMHTLGDFSLADENRTLFHRTFAKVAVKTLKENHLTYTVWINHGNKSNVGNFGDIKSTYQQGDLKSSPYYISDLILASGVKFVWTGRDDHFGLPSMIYPITLRDGHSCFGFHRYTDDGFSRSHEVLWNWNPLFFNKQLSAIHLRELENKHEYSIVAQHLGGNSSPLPFYGRNLAALVRLEQEYKHGRILVARTSRLLQYNEVQQYLHANIELHNGKATIVIDQVRDPVLGYYRPTLDQVRGVTFYTSNPYATTIKIGKHPVPFDQLRRNPPDQTGVPSLQIAWWPVDMVDYTKHFSFTGQSHTNLFVPDKRNDSQKQDHSPLWLWREDHM